MITGGCGSGTTKVFLTSILIAYRHIEPRPNSFKLVVERLARELSCIGILVDVGRGIVSKACISDGALRRKPLQTEWIQYAPDRSFSSKTFFHHFGNAACEGDAFSWERDSVGLDRTPTTRLASSRFHTPKLTLQSASDGRKRRNTSSVRARLHCIKILGHTSSYTVRPERRNHSGDGGERAQGEGNLSACMVLRGEDD